MYFITHCILALIAHIWQQRPLKCFTSITMSRKFSAFCVRIIRLPFCLSWSMNATQNTSPGLVLYCCRLDDVPSLNLIFMLCITSQMYVCTLSQNACNTGPNVDSMKSHGILTHERLSRSCYMWMTLPCSICSQQENDLKLFDLHFIS